MAPWGPPEVLEKLPASLFASAAPVPCMLGGPLIRKNLGEFSAFCKVCWELLRATLHLLDPVKHLRICSE